MVLLGLCQPAFAELPETTQDSFNKDVLSSSKPVVVEFSAAWCGYCKKLAPILEDMSKNYTGRATFVKVDVDKNPMLKAQYKIGPIPRVLIFRTAK